MRAIVSLLLLLALVQVSFGIEEEDGVLVLTQDNYQTTIEEHPFLLIEFYAPWCGHCKELEPEYKKAAETLRKEQPPIYIAKCDATVNADLAKKYEVSSYPTLKLIIKGSVIDYKDERKEKAIVDLLIKKNGIKVKTVSSSKEIKDLSENNDVVLVLFASEEHEKFGLFEAQAKNNEDLTFASCDSEECWTSYNLNSGNVLLLKKFDENRNDLTDEVTEFSLDEFISLHSSQLVMKWDQKIAGKIFGNKGAGLFLYRDPNSERSDDLDKLMHEVAKDLKGTIMVVATGITEGFETRLAEYVGIKSKDLPTVRIHDSKGDLKKYNLEGEITKESVLQFVRNWEKDLLTPSYKSEDIPDNQDGPVYIVVGKSFDKVVLDETKDVLIEFYAPWCGHCKQLTPIFDELGKRMKHNPNLIIAKMDSTVNETSKVSITGYPTIKFFKATDKYKPIDYTGGRDSADAFIEFLQKNVAFPLSESKTEL